MLILLIDFRIREMHNSELIGWFLISGSNVSAYIGMVCDALRNSIPKAVVHCQVREAKKSLLHVFYAQIGRREVMYLNSDSADASKRHLIGINPSQINRFWLVFPILNSFSFFLVSSSLLKWILDTHTYYRSGWSCVIHIKIGHLNSCYVIVFIVFNRKWYILKLYLSTFFCYK